MTRFVALALLAAALLAPAAGSVASGKFAYRATVTRVIDGDTLEARIGLRRERVRLIGIDAPERGRCYADRAASRLTTLALNKRVLLRGDPTQQTRDRYGRLLAYVDVAGVADAGALLIAGGYAKSYTYGRVEFVRVDKYEAREAAARTAKLGIWNASACVAVTPPPPADPPPAPPPPPSKAACGDGVDNDADGKVDWPADTGCTDSLDSDESDVVTVVPPPTQNCSPAYPDFCIPPPPPDLDCGDIGRKDFRVLAPDPHRFDGDHDGVGCEG